MKPDLDAVDRPDGGRREQWLARGGVDDVGGEILKSRAGERGAVPDAAIDRMAPAALQPLQLQRSAIELVVADRRERQSDRVQRFDGRLVVKQSRNQRRRADEIAGGDDNRIRLLLDGALEMCGQVFGAAGQRLTDASVAAGRRFEVAVEIVEGEELNRCDRRRRRGRWAARASGNASRTTGRSSRRITPYILTSSASSRSYDIPYFLTSLRHLLRASLRYSYRSAFIGSIREARRAGM